MENQSSANMSAPFTALTGIGILDKPNQYLSKNIHPDSIERLSLIGQNGWKNAFEFP